MVSAPHPRESLERCALRAQLRGDPMLGTAFPASRLLLVEQPGPWGRQGLASSRLDARIAAELHQRALAAGMRVQVIRKPGRTEARAPRRWATVDTTDGHESLRWGTFHADAELGELDLDRVQGTVDTEPLFLVCTHGKHDTCCALRGRPVAAAIAGVRPDRVFETTHVGGDRFAANVLVLPAGLLYGRVLPFAAAEFVAAADADEVVGALLRGRVGLPPAAQAALAFGYEHLALRSRTALRVVSAGPVVDGVSVTRLSGPHGMLDVTVAVETVAATGLTCANPRPNQYVRHRPVSIARVE